jgi:hypothetical protein
MWTSAASDEHGGYACCSYPDDTRCRACDAFGKRGMSPFYCRDGWCDQSP